MDISSTSLGNNLLLLNKTVMITCYVFDLKLGLFLLKRHGERQRRMTAVKAVGGPASIKAEHQEEVPVLA